MNIYEGRLLNLETVDLCKRKFAKDCEITFPEKIPVIYDFNKDPVWVLGHADISKDEKGLSCKVTPNLGSTSFDNDEYFVGGCYEVKKSHTEGDVKVIDSCRLVSMSIVPDNKVSDINLKIHRK